MVSVIIPSYNRKNTLIRAVKSLTVQTYSDLEIIIVDDGSTDGTKEELKKFRDNRIRYIQQEHKGACAARNLGIENALGEYIAFHDSDDVCKSDRIENQLHTIVNTKADMVCGNVCIHEKRGTTVAPLWPVGWIKSKNYLCYIGTITFFAKREVFREIKFDPVMPRWQDLDILIRIYDKYRIYFGKDILVDYYKQEDSISNNPQKCIDAFELMQVKYPYIQKEYKILYGRLLKLYAQNKIEMGRKDYVDDFVELYKCIRTKKNLVWLIFAKLHMADWVYKIARWHFKG